MKKMIVALSIAVLLIAGLFIFTHHMSALADEWAAQGIELTLPERIMMGIAAFWSRFGLITSPFILAGCLAVGVTTSLIWPQRH